jgi:hypothetical protein
MNNPATEEQIEAIYERIYDEQEARIKKRFGRDAAANANYGWSTASDEDVIEVATKTYTDPRMVLVSRAVLKSGAAIDHSWHEYEPLRRAL